jgi:prepilin-type N-terminal cleavage/methylation domain-containing protein
MSRRQQPKPRAEAGFSLAELMVAMAVTLVLMVAAATLLAAAFNTRTRENVRTEALADAQRALNIMSREIANAGFNLTTNGLVDGDSTFDATTGRGSIRVRSNLNKYDSGVSAAARGGIGVVGTDTGEDVKFFLSDAANTTYLVRYDPYATTQATVLANRVDALRFFFYDDRVSYTTGNCQALPNPTLISNVLNTAGGAAAQVAPSAARYVVIAACIRLEAVGTPGVDGYQPSTSVLLVSDVALRNMFVSEY